MIVECRFTIVAMSYIHLTLFIMFLFLRPHLLRLEYQPVLLLVNGSDCWELSMYNKQHNNFFTCLICLSSESKFSYICFSLNYYIWYRLGHLLSERLSFHCLPWVLRSITVIGLVLLFISLKLPRIGDRPFGGVDTPFTTPTIPFSIACILAILKETRKGWLQFRKQSSKKIKTTPC